jgi:hypothetical protein
MLECGYINSRALVLYYFRKCDSMQTSFFTLMLKVISERLIARLCRPGRFLELNFARHSIVVYQWVTNITHVILLNYFCNRRYNSQHRTNTRVSVLIKVTKSACSNYNSERAEEMHIHFTYYWSLNVREESTFMVFENKHLKKIFGLKRQEVTGERRKLHKEQHSQFVGSLLTTYCSDD